MHLPLFSEMPKEQSYGYIQRRTGLLFGDAAESEEAKKITYKSYQLSIGKCTQFDFLFPVESQRNFDIECMNESIKITLFHQIIKNAIKVAHTDNPSEIDFIKEEIQKQLVDSQLNPSRGSFKKYIGQDLQDLVIDLKNKFNEKKQ